MLCNENCQIELITYQHVVRRKSVVYRVKKKHKDLIVYMRKEEMCINKKFCIWSGPENKHIRGK